MHIKMILLAVAFASSVLPAFGNTEVNRYYVDVPAAGFPDPQSGAIQKAGIIDFLCTTAPANPASGQIRLYCDSGTGLLTCLTSAGTNACPTGSGGGGSFSTITSGTNTGQAMVVGNSSSLTTTGTGSIVATAVPYSGITSFPAACGASPHFFATQLGPTNQGCTQANFTDLAGTIALSQTPLTTVGDVLSVSAVPALTRVAGGLTGSILMSTNGSPASFSPPGIAGRTAAGTSDTILCDSGTALRDRGATVKYTSGSAIAVTLPQAGSSGCGNNFVTKLFVTGAGTATVTPTVSTINGNATLPITQNGWCVISSPDNTNYIATCFGGVVLARRVCMIVVGVDNGSALGNADLGPQGRRCFIAEPATVVEVTVAADAGTPNVIPAKNHAGVTSNFVSSALATGSAGAIACSNTGGTTGIDGATTCSGTLQNTSLAAGDWVDLISGTAGGTAKRMSISVTYTVN